MRRKTLRGYLNFATEAIFVFGRGIFTPAEGDVAVPTASEAVVKSTGRRRKARSVANFKQPLKNLAVIACAVWIVCGSGFAQPEGSGGRAGVAPEPDPVPRRTAAPPSRVPVDYMGDVITSAKAGDSSVYVIVGNVVFHHNGTIVECDSAIRYNDLQFEGFGNVIIKKDSAFIYGDRLDYDGYVNVANVYAPIVKTVDGDATMYSYDLSFNTLTSVASYTLGGTLTQKDNLMESQRADYHTETRTIYFEDKVVMRNDNYLLRTDSLNYNFDTEVSRFFRNTRIWNSSGDFLSSDRGIYERPGDKYTFNDNSYILTPIRQLWADSMIYMQTDSIAYLFDNIQIQDDEQNALAFGDHGVYWGGPGDAILTRKPSVVTIEEKASGERDTAYTSADSIFLFTVTLRPGSDTDSLSGADSLDIMDIPQEYYDRLEQSVGDSVADGTGVAADSLAVTTDAGGLETVEPEAAPESMPEITDTLSSPQPEPEPVEKTRHQMRKEFRAIRLLIRLGVPGYDPSMITRLRPADSLALDSAGVYADSLATQVDSLAGDLTDSTGLYEVVAPVDSIQRVIKAYYNVKVFRSDFQAVADSMVSFSSDSTAHMYRSLVIDIEQSVQPVLWNESNQIFSDQMHFFSADGELEHAEFEGSPLMAEQITDSMYNQMAGRIIYAYFRNNDIEKLLIDGSGETYYYSGEEGEEPTEFMSATSSQITFTFDTLGVSGIKYYEDVHYDMFPADDIPLTQATRMRNFHWYGDLRPQTKEAVFDRAIRPSRREEAATTEKPVFEITATINGDRERFMEEGIWRERNDEPHITPDFFNQRYGRGQ